MGFLFISPTAPIIYLILQLIRSFHTFVLNFIATTTTNTNTNTNTTITNINNNNYNAENNNNNINNSNNNNNNNNNNNDNNDNSDDFQIALYLQSPLSLYNVMIKHTY